MGKPYSWDEKAIVIKKERPAGRGMAGRGGDPFRVDEGVGEGCLFLIS